MLRFVWAQSRGRLGRSVALLGAVLVATTGFTVLTGATATGRLRVTGTVAANARGAYDILVRPHSSRTPLESDTGRVRGNALSGQFGGISMAQYARVKAITGIDVAAPIAMLGYATTNVSTSFDVTNLVDRSLDQQIIRVDPTFATDRGLSRATGAPAYVFITKHRLAWPAQHGTFSEDRQPFDNGYVLRNDTTCHGMAAALDLDAPGGPKPICGVYPTNDVTSDKDVTYVDVLRLMPDGKFQTVPQAGRELDTAELTVFLHMPFLVAAVDPVAEDRLVGLGGALVKGHGLSPADKVTEHTGADQRYQTAPVIASNRSFVDAAIDATFSRLRPDTPVAGVPIEAIRANLKAAPAYVLEHRKADQEPSFQHFLDQSLGRQDYGPIRLNGLLRVGPPTYTRTAGGALVATTVPPDPQIYAVTNVYGSLAPWQSDDTSFRSMTRAPGAEMGSTSIDGVLTGLFDPSRLTSFNELNQVPMEAYQPPGVTGNDRRSKELLGGQALVPDGNPAGYVAEPPMFLTSLSVVAGLASSAPKDPISAIRVRVADVTGFTPASRERVRLVAERIATETGLDVDITYGSSAEPQSVELAAGKYGRPALQVSESWSKRGVAAAIVRAVDRKSAVLFVLVLVVCALFLLNAVSAAVRDRRAELAVLACLGWPARRIGAAVLVEILGIGLAAGVLGLAVSIPVGHAVGVGIGLGHALLAVPVAVALALVAGIVPAVRAAATHPAGALRPAARRTRRRHRPPGVMGLATVNLWRVPGRTTLGAVALAVGVAALTVLAAVTFAFRGAIVGTVLGDAVSLQVRGVDAVAVGATVLLGAFAVADVLYLNIRDRAAELASLRAAGWTDGALARLVTYEGLGIGVLGAVVGAAVGLGGAAWLVGALPSALITTAALTAVAGIVVAGLAALVPAALLRRLPIARLLAEE